MRRVVNRVSGPVSMHVYEVPTSCLVVGRKQASTYHAVFLFGDEHKSYENRCANCSEHNGCFDIVRFIEYLCEVCRDGQTSLDVFVEFPYIVGSDPLRSEFLHYVNKYMTKESTSSAKVAVNNALGKVAGMTPKQVGILGELYKRFADRFYAHHRRQQWGGRHRCRFHYSDARWEPNVWVYMRPPPDRPHDALMTWVRFFYRKVPDLATYRRLLQVFMFGKDFPADIRAIFGRNAPVTYSSLSRVEHEHVEGSGVATGDKGKKNDGGSSGNDHRPRVVHKIAKQYHALVSSSGATREAIAAVRAFLHDRTEEVLRFLDAEVLYGREGLPHFHADARRLSAFLLATRLLAPVLLMDAYLVCRHVRYMSSSSSSSSSEEGGGGGCSVIYAGDAHVAHFDQFFRDYMKVQPSLRRVAGKAGRGGGRSRCVSVAV